MSDTKNSWLVKAMGLPSFCLDLLLGSPARRKRALQLSQLALCTGAIAVGGCGCAFKGPVTGTNYEVRPYEYGVELKGDFLNIKIGQQSEIKSEQNKEK